MYFYFLNKISVKIIVIIISEQSLDGWESWENVPVKFSNVNVTIHKQKIIMLLKTSLLLSFAVRVVLEKHTY